MQHDIIVITSNVDTEESGAKEICSENQAKNHSYTVQDSRRRIHVRFHIYILQYS